MYLKVLIKFFGQLFVQFQSGGPTLVLDELPSDVFLLRRGIVSQRREVAITLQRLSRNFYFVSFDVTTVTFRLYSLESFL